MSLTGHDKQELFEVEKVIRHSDRMGVWLKLLNLEKDNIILQGMKRRGEYTPRQNDTDFWLDMLINCKEYMGFNDGHLTLTPAGLEFKKKLAETIDQKHPLTIMRLDVKPAKNAKKDRWDRTDETYNGIALQCTIGKRELDIMITCDRSESYYEPGTFDETVQLSVKDHSEKEYSYYTPASLMKPVTLQALNGDQFINKLKAILTDDQRVLLAGFVLKKELCWRQLL